MTPATCAGHGRATAEPAAAPAPAQERALRVQCPGAPLEVGYSISMSEEACLPEEQSWARRLRGGDVSALEEAFRAYYARLCSFVRHHVGSAESAEEIVQDVFLRVWERRARLDPEGSLRALLYSAARNAALNHIKHRQIEGRWAAAARTMPERLAAEAEDGVREHELSGAIAASIAALPERCRLIFLMSRQQGLSYADIALILGLSVKTVETQMGRALKALRAHLAPFLA